MPPSSWPIMNVSLFTLSSKLHISFTQVNLEILGIIPHLFLFIFSISVENIMRNSVIETKHVVAFIPISSVFLTQCLNCPSWLPMSTCIRFHSLKCILSATISVTYCAYVFQRPHDCFPHLSILVQQQTGPFKIQINCITDYLTTSHRSLFTSLILKQGSLPAPNCSV